jgi:ribonuclease III
MSLEKKRKNNYFKRRLLEKSKEKEILSEASLGLLEKKIGYSFKDLGLLRGALMHSSLLPKGVYDFDRLEFLGDKILGSVIALWLFQVFPKESEGDLSKRFIEYTRSECLQKISKAIKLEDFLCWDSPKNVPFQKILSDGCEALLGAIFLDSNFDVVLNFIQRWWQPYFSKDIAEDPKSLLQEYLQGKYNCLPDYETIGVEGPNHHPVFTIRLQAPGILIEAQGSSKKEAERCAAQKALEAITFARKP